MDTKSIIEILQAVCFLPAAMIYALKAAGAELTTEDKKTVIRWAITITTATHSKENTKETVLILSRSIRSIKSADSSELIKEFTDAKILELVQAAQTGGVDNGKCTD